VPKRSLSCHVHVAFPKNLNESTGLLRGSLLAFFGDGLSRFRQNLFIQSAPLLPWVQAGKGLAKSFTGSGFFLLLEL